MYGDKPAKALYVGVVSLPVLYVLELASGMLCHRGDNSPAVFSILLILLCAFHDTVVSGVNDARAVMLQMLMEKGQRAVGMLEGAGAGQTWHPNDFESLEQFPALDTGSRSLRNSTTTEAAGKVLVTRTSNKDGACQVRSRHGMQ